MPRDENTQYEQDRLGNENRKLDTLRGQEGQQTGDSGLTEIGSADTDSVNTLYTLPDHADRVFVTRAYGFNSVASGNNTFTLFDVELDSDGNITSSNRRSVPLTVGSASTDHYEYEGRAFENDIGVESEFEGWVGIGLVVDHDEESEDLST
jgi:hypothetical protein